MVLKFIRCECRFFMIELTDKQKEEIQKLADLVQKEAELVIKDYEDNPSEMSGSVIHVHENSPILYKKNVVGNE